MPSSVEVGPAAGFASIRVLEMLVAALVVARLLAPPEGSVLGLTLWITQAWFVVALLAVWFRLRDGGPVRKFDRLDLALFVLAAGHLVSGLRLIVLRDGDRRLALNMVWEWAALAVSFVLLRLVLDEPGRRAAWQRGLVALAVAVSGLGVWQHYVGHALEVRRYDALWREFDEWTAKTTRSNDEAAERERQLTELRREFARQQIPQEGPARRQFEDRLRGSSEPIGLFALANTLAGWLAAWGIVLAGAVVGYWRRTADPNQGVRRLGRALGVAALGLIAFCLLLTKSRTAWVGTACGLSIWAALAWNERRRACRSNAAVDAPGDDAAVDAATHAAAPDKTAAVAAPAVTSEATAVAVSAGRSKSRLIAFAAGAVVLAALVAVAVSSGGLDREVVAQAPRSLRFRLQYWSGALAVLRERWLWGTGPGNFRPHYLKHKLPEASEEIADPHNFMLDVWASGGLIALVGLFGVGLALATRAGASDDGASSVASADHASPRSAGPLRVDSPSVAPTSRFGMGAAAAFVAWIGGLAWMGAELDELQRMTAVGAGTAAAWRLLRRPMESGASSACLFGATGALLIHLLGAGGIEMPAVTQCLLILAVLVGPHSRSCEAASAGTPVWRPMLAGAAALAACVACLLSATRPVLLAETSIAAGDVEAARGLFGPAERHYAAAATADPLSPVPFERMTELFLARGRTRTRDAERDLDKALDTGRVVLELDPHDPGGYRMLGEVFVARHARTHAAADANEAVRWFDEAAARSPNHSRLRAARATALAAAGRSRDAASEAAVALELDTVNRREGHIDKYLPEDVVARMNALTEEAADASREDDTGT